MTHGTYSGYTRHGCRCLACTRANREYQHDRNLRRRQTPATLPKAQVRGLTLVQSSDDTVERRVTGISGMTSGSVLTSSGVKVWCRCGNSGYANKWVVGNTRRIDHCAECS